MSRFEETVARFIGGRATPDDLLDAVEGMSPLEGDEYEFVLTTLSNLAVSGQLSTDFYHKLLHTTTTGHNATRTQRNRSTSGQIEETEDRTVIFEEDDPTKVVPSGPPSIAQQHPSDVSSRTGSDSTDRWDSTSQEPALSSGRHRSTGSTPHGTGRRSDSGLRSSVSNSAGSSWSDLSNSTGSGRVIGEGSILKNRFVLERLIGQGGMGLVFKARDRMKEEAQDRNPYLAVKILNDSFKRHPESLKALQREARKSQQLAHPNIVNVFDFDRDGDTVYMTMEFLEGQSLHDAIKSRGGRVFPLEVAIKFTKQMAAALEHAHDHGIIHSDFKPGNVYLTEDGVVKVFDFGIARANTQVNPTAGEETKFDAGVLGAMTPAYASREMLEGRPPEPNDDIYALGCVAYELITGRHPYNHRPANTILGGSDVEKPAGLSRRQWRTLRKAIAIERISRTASVEEFLKGFSDDDQTQLFKGIAGVAAGLLVIGAAVLFGVDRWNQSKLQEIDANLRSRDSVMVTQGRAALELLEPAERDALLTAVTPELTEYYVAESRKVANQEEKLYDYPGAAQILAEAAKLYPFNSTIRDAKTVLDLEKFQLINNLDLRFRRALENKWVGLTLANGELNVHEVLDIVSQVDPESALLTDERLIPLYQDAASDAIDAVDFTLAKTLLRTGLERFPDHVGLENQLFRIERDEVLKLRAVEIETLTNGLNARVGMLSSVADFEALTAPLGRLSDLDPNSGTVLAVKEAVAEILSNEVRGSLMQYDWAAAQNMLSTYASFVDGEISSKLQLELKVAQADRERSITDQYREIVVAVGVDRLHDGENSAITALQKFVDLGVGENQLFRARAMIGQAYLDRSRKYRTRGQWTEATGAVARGLVMNPGEDIAQLLNRETVQIAEAIDLAKQARDVAEREMIARDRARRITGLETQINNALDGTPIGLPGLPAVLNLIEELGSMDARAAEEFNGRERLAEHVVEHTRALTRRGEISAALELVEGASGLLPASIRLFSEISRVEAAIAETEAQALANRTRQAREDLNALLDDPRFTDDWQENIRKLLREPVLRRALSAQQVSSIHTDVAGLFKHQAELALSDSQFSASRSMMNKGQQWKTDQLGWDALRASLLEAEAAFISSSEAQARRAQLEGLKLTFRTQILAFDLQAAGVTMTKLADMEPGDSFVSGQAVYMLGDAYLVSVEQATKAGRFQEAVERAETGLARLPGYGALSGARDSALFESKAENVQGFFDSGRGSEEDTRRLLVEMRQLTRLKYGLFVKTLGQRLAEELQQLANQDLDRADKLLVRNRRLLPDSPALAELSFAPLMRERQDRMEQQNLMAEAIERLMSNARVAEQNSEYVTGTGAGAVEILHEVLRQDPQHAGAKAELNRLHTQVYVQAIDLLTADKLPAVAQSIDVLVVINRYPNDIADLREALSDAEQDHAIFDGYIGAALQAIDEEDLIVAEEQYRLALQVKPNHNVVPGIAETILERYHRLAARLYDEEKYDTSIDLIERGLAFDGGDSRLRNLRAEVIRSRKNSQKQKKPLNIPTF